MKERSEGTVIVDELSTLIDKNSFQNGMISLLTTLWDSPSEFEYRTRARGKETLRNCYLNILGGSTSQWIKEAVPVVAIGGGFTSRVLFVYKEAPEKLVAFPEMTPENRTRGLKLMGDMNRIASLRGAFRMTPQAKMFYSQDYEKWAHESDMIHDKNLSGYAGRRHTMMLKLGMVVSASKRDSKVIHESDLRIALKMLESVEETLPRVMESITSEQVGDICEDVLRFVKQKKIIKRSQVMRKYANRLSSKELGVILDTLIEMRVIVQEGTDLNDMTIVYIGKDKK
jgi:hypothetical protein